MALERENCAKEIKWLHDEIHKLRNDMAGYPVRRDELKGADPSAVAKCVAKVLSARRPPRRVTVGPIGERIGPLAKRLLPSKAFESASASSLGV